ncbi:MAG: hypothetical protein GX799_11920 [Crenarchaeota archaeon]|nr:hypothetical protein [Thermoproteota archaeon]
MAMGKSQDFSKPAGLFLFCFADFNNLKLGGKSFGGYAKATLAVVAF